MSATRDFWISVLSQVIAYCLLISLPILFSNFFFDIQVDSPLYFVADNLMLLTIPTGLILLLLRDVHQLHYRERFPMAVLPFIFTGSFVLVLVSLWRIDAHLSLMTLLYSLLISVNISALTYLSLIRLPDVIALVPDRIAIFMLYLLMLLIVLASYLVRQAIPGNPMLDYGFAPLMIFIVPGLSLVNMLLPPGASLIERLLKSIPVSIGWYAILSAWAFQTGILISDNSLYAFAILAIGCALIGLFVQRYFKS